MTPVIKGFLAVTGGLFNLPDEINPRDRKKKSQAADVYLVPNGAAVARSVTPSSMMPT